MPSLIEITLTVVSTALKRLMQLFVFFREISFTTDDLNLTQARIYNGCVNIYV